MHTSDISKYIRIVFITVKQSTDLLVVKVFDSFCRRMSNNLGGSADVGSANDTALSRVLAPGVMAASYLSVCELMLGVLMQHSKH